ncbi:hypothetical protein ACI1UM_04175 [Lactococcus petauri]|uniref:hypothetical protein n=1 Tax=Lactococcus petauri TaxID=1940789 RepID=UPI003851C14A
MDKKIYMLLKGIFLAQPVGLGGSVLRRANALVKDGTPNEYSFTNIKIILTMNFIWRENLEN